MVVYGTSNAMENAIREIIEVNRGFVTRKDIDARGIPSVYLSRYVRKLGLRRIARGFYAEEGWIIDPYVVFQYSYPKFVYSFGSAVYLHGLGDILPGYLEVTGPLNYRPMSEKREDVITHTDTVDISYGLGIVDITTSLGNAVRAYDKEKTVCDLIRHKEKVEFETYTKALNLYARSKDRDINKLMEYARILKIEKEVRSQMEVLLNVN